MRKAEELTSPNSYMTRADDDEMTFVLLARDVAAPAIIREWCRLRCNVYLKNRPLDAQITEALACASEMERQYIQRRKVKS